MPTTISDIRHRANQTAHQLAERPKVAPFIDHGREYTSAVQEHRLTGLAAEVAFFAVLSMFPAILALASAMGSIDAVIGEDAAARVQDALVEVLRNALGADAGPIADAVERLFAESNTGLIGLGIVLTLFTVSRGFNAVIKALDVVYDVPETRGLVRTRLLALGLAAGSLLVGAAAMAMVVLGPMLGQGVELADRLGFGDAFVTMWTWVRPPLVVLALTGWAAAMFHLAPNHHTPWRKDFPGAIVTMLLWLLGTGGFRIYLEVASNDANAVLGALGGALTLLLWLYVMGLGLLLGAEVNAQLTRRRRRRIADATAEEFAAAVARAPTG
ncbi:MAG: YihY/virulence factor BrkB family protein [Acidimicrobiales bacterium]|nr:YihY/virulence factor BrkB family protein [Acidimicrobiales bacterium]